MDMKNVNSVAYCSLRLHNYLIQRNQRRPMNMPRKLLRRVQQTYATDVNDVGTNNAVRMRNTLKHYFSVAHRLSWQRKKANIGCFD